MNRNSLNKGKYYLTRRNNRLQKVKDLLYKYLNINIDTNPLDDNEPLPMGPLLRVFIEREFHQFKLTPIEKVHISRGNKLLIFQAIEKRQIGKILYLLPRLVFPTEWYQNIRAVLLLLQSSEFQTISTLTFTSNIDETRLLLRRHLPTLNIFGAFGVIPFMLGIGYFLRNKYTSTNIHFVLGETLPLFATPLETLSWETFEYNAKHDLDPTDGAWYSNMLMLRKQTNNSALNISISTLDKSFLLTRELRDRSSVQEIYRKLDQLPAKLESFNSITVLQNVNEQTLPAIENHLFQNQNRFTAKARILRDHNHKEKDFSCSSPKSVAAAKTGNFSRQNLVHYRDFHKAQDEYSKLKNQTESKINPIFRKSLYNVNLNKKVSYSSIMEAFFEQQTFRNTTIRNTWPEFGGFPTTFEEWAQIRAYSLPILLQEQIAQALHQEVDNLQELQSVKKAFFSLAHQTVTNENSINNEQAEDEYMEQLKTFQNTITIGELLAPKNKDNDVLSSIETVQSTPQSTTEQEIEKTATTPTHEEKNQSRLADYRTALANLEITPDEIAKQVEAINQSIKTSKRSIQFLKALTMETRPSAIFKTKNTPETNDKTSSIQLGEKRVLKFYKKHDPTGFEQQDKQIDFTAGLPGNPTMESPLQAPEIDPSDSFTNANNGKLSHAQRQRINIYLTLCAKQANSSKNGIDFTDTIDIYENESLLHLQNQNKKNRTLTSSGRNIQHSLLEDLVSSYAIPTRQMSGYKHPDTHESTLISQIIWNFFFKNTNYERVKISLPVNVAKLKEFMPHAFQSQAIPPIRIQLSNTKNELSHPEFSKSQTSLKPPILPNSARFFDPLRNFDLTIQLETSQNNTKTANAGFEITTNQNQQPIYSWLWDRISPYNPFATQQVHYATDESTWATQSKPTQSWPASLFIEQAVPSGSYLIRPKTIKKLTKLQEEQAKNNDKQKESTEFLQTNSTKAQSEVGFDKSIDEQNVTEANQPRANTITTLPDSETYVFPRIGPLNSILREHPSFLPWENDVYVVSVSKNEWQRQLDRFQTVVETLTPEKHLRSQSIFTRSWKEWQTRLLDKLQTVVEIVARKKTRTSVRPITRSWEDWQTMLLILDGKINLNLPHEGEARGVKQKSSKTNSKKRKKETKQDKEAAQEKSRKKKKLLNPVEYSLITSSYPADPPTLLPLITMKRPISGTVDGAFDNHVPLEYHFEAPVDVNSSLQPVFVTTGTPYENTTGMHLETYHRLGSPLTPQVSTLNIFEHLLQHPILNNFLENHPVLEQFIQKTMRPLKLIDSNLFGPTYWESFEVNTVSPQNWIFIGSGIGLTYLIFLIGQDSLLMYARETVSYIMILAVQLGMGTASVKEQISLFTEETDFTYFRILSRVTKNWRNVAGTRVMTPELVDMVITFRMMKKFKAKRIWRTFPTGFLFHGPPGTGKTLLVQILASEAQVPVISLSAEAILQDHEHGADRLAMAFEEAQRLAPAILFLDEIDGLGQRRPEIAKPDRHWWVKTFWEEEAFDTIADEPIAYTGAEPPKMRPSNDRYRDYFRLRTQQLQKLVLLLVELDDISKSRPTSGVVVIGATNRIEVLDPALRRPGRLENTIYFDLPDAEKRGELVELYAKGIGFDASLSTNTQAWRYLLDRTYAFTPADIAIVMKESGIKSLILETKHTLETIEHGIERVLTECILKPKNSDPAALSTLQLAYHQAGKIILGALLPDVAPVVVAYLWPHELNTRGKRIQALREEKIAATIFPQPFGNQLTACYAGMAAEVLFLQHGSSRNTYAAMSTLGTEDMALGHLLSSLMVKSKYFYSINSDTLDWVNIASNMNESEFTRNRFLLKRRRMEAVVDDKQTLDFEFKQFLMRDLTRETEYKFDEAEVPNLEVQERTQDTGWWYRHFKTMYQDHDLGFDPSGRFARKILFRDEWNCIYYDDQKTWRRNLDFLKPEVVLQTHDFASNLTGTRLKWTQISDTQVEYQTHSLILSAFNKALVMLENNRELLDTIVCALINKQILRAPDIEDILEKFNYSSKKESLVTTITPTIDSHNTPRIVAKDWGLNSRRPSIRWIDMRQIRGGSEL